jgi:putative restriction endonuclease
MVTMFLAITDRTWFDLLSAAQPDEVNFWQPSGGKGFRALAPGELFLFKLHSPNDYIVGGGVFSHASNVPLSMAWDAFGAKNGVVSLADMRRRIAHYRRDKVVDPRQDPVIGCRILTQPFFLPREQWIPVPASFSRNIVSGKRFSTAEADGAALWDAVAERIATVSPPALLSERLGAPRLVRPRLGQGAFRLAVTDAYERRCAVSGEKTLPILDAAHIHSFADGGVHEAANGLLLRTDIHRLFDLGYVTVAEDLRFEVSHRLKADFDNGKHYYDLHGAAIRGPQRGYAPPAAAALSWHREHRYLG